MGVVGQSVLGFVSGAVFAPCCAIAGANIFATLSNKTDGAAKEQASAVGVLCAGAVLVSVLESSPFMTGFKVATIATTIITASVFALRTVSAEVGATGRRCWKDLRRAYPVSAFVYGSVIGAICTVAGFAVFPGLMWVGVAVGSNAAYMITYKAEQWAIEPALR